MVSGPPATVWPCHCLFRPATVTRKRLCFWFFWKLISSSLPFYILPLLLPPSSPSSLLSPSLLILLLLLLLLPLLSPPGYDRKTNYVAAWANMIDATGTPVKVEFGGKVPSGEKQEWVYESISNTLPSLLEPSMAELMSKVRLLLLLLLCLSFFKKQKLSLSFFLLSLSLSLSSCSLSSLSLSLVSVCLLQLTHYTLLLLLITLLLLLFLCDTSTLSMHTLDAPSRCTLHLPP